MEISKTINKRLVIVAVTALILFGITWRLLPHTPNFAPISAIALVSGLAFGWRKSLLILFVIMAVSDLAIGSYSSMHWTWLGFGLIAGLGFMLKKLPAIWRLPIGALGASTLFFLVSNFGTWVSSGMYSLDITGLAQCYTMALPFFRATLQSDLIFSILLFTAYETFLVVEKKGLLDIKYVHSKQRVHQWHSITTPKSLEF